MGEFEVHRVRFFGLVPAGVRCLACQPRGGRLALARTNGAVEIYNFAANYFQEKVRGPGRAGPGRTGLRWGGPGRARRYEPYRRRTGSYRSRTWLYELYQAVPPVPSSAGLCPGVLVHTGSYRAALGCARARPGCIWPDQLVPVCRSPAGAVPGRAGPCQGVTAVSPQVIPGHETRSVEALCWAAGERLFGAGLSGDVTEYDLAGLRAGPSVDGGGGPIWSMAADGSGTRLAVSAARHPEQQRRDCHYRPAGADPGPPAGRLRGWLREALPGGARGDPVRAEPGQAERWVSEGSVLRQHRPSVPPVRPGVTSGAAFPAGRILCLSWHPSGTHIAAGSIDILRVLDVGSGESPPSG